MLAIIETLFDTLRLMTFQPMRKTSYPRARAATRDNC